MARPTRSSSSHSSSAPPSSRSSTQLRAALSTLALTPEEAGDVKFIRAQHSYLAQHGCGQKHCPADTCLVARQSRVIVKALEALEANIRTLA